MVAKPKGKDQKVRDPGMIGMFDFNYDHRFSYFALFVMLFAGVAISSHNMIGMKFNLAMLMLGGYFNFIHRLKYLIAEI